MLSFIYSLCIRCVSWCLFYIAASRTVCVNMTLSRCMILECYLLPNVSFSQLCIPSSTIRTQVLFAKTKPLQSKGEQIFHNFRVCSGSYLMYIRLMMSNRYLSICYGVASLPLVANVNIASLFRCS